MVSFAEIWIDAWNRRDVPAILEHFSEDAQFLSPMAQSLIGLKVVKGRRQIAKYWRAALDHVVQLQFRLDHVVWDEERRELIIIYEATLNSDRKRACEIMQFDASGRVMKGEALYGKAL